MAWGRWRAGGRQSAAVSAAVSACIGRRIGYLPRPTRARAVPGGRRGADPTTDAMAKKSWIARNERKKKTVDRCAELRRKLKEEKDYVALSMLPRDASPTRVVNRCQVTGRRRAFMRRFKLSRITFREMASAGMVPGVTKSSW